MVAGKEKEVSVIMVYYCAVNAFTKRATVEIDRETKRHFVVMMKAHHPRGSVFTPWTLGSQFRRAASCVRLSVFE
ncbi:unnamed protein product, partial [Arctogadus glacialis]